MTQNAPIAEPRPRYRSSRPRAGRFTAGTASRSTSRRTGSKPVHQTFSQLLTATFLGIVTFTVMRSPRDTTPPLACYSSDRVARRCLISIVNLVRKATNGARRWGGRIIRPLAFCWHRSGIGSGVERFYPPHHVPDLDLRSLASISLFTTVLYL
jgi:hypothetical protein